MSDRDLKILNDRKSTLVNKINWHKGKLAELEGELENINNFLEKISIHSSPLWSIRKDCG